MVTAFSLSLSLSFWYFALCSVVLLLLLRLTVSGIHPVVLRLPHPDMMSFLLLLKESFCSFEALFSRNSQSLHVCVSRGSCSGKEGRRGQLRRAQRWRANKDHCEPQQSGVPENRDELTEHWGDVLVVDFKKRARIQIEGFLPAPEVKKKETHRFRDHNKR